MTTPDEEFHREHPITQPHAIADLARRDNVFEEWLTRTEGKVPMNDAEHIRYIKVRALAGNSFAAEDVLWIFDYFEKQLEKAAS